MLEDSASKGCISPYTAVCGGLDGVGGRAQVAMGAQVKNPGRDIPIGMCGALIIVTTLYFLCAVTLTLMLPYDLISPDAAFSQVP